MIHINWIGLKQKISLITFLVSVAAMWSYIWRISDLDFLFGVDELDMILREVIFTVFPALMLWTDHWRSVIWRSLVDWTALRRFQMNSDRYVRRPDRCGVRDYTFCIGVKNVYVFVFDIFCLVYGCVVYSDILCK